MTPLADLSDMELVHALLGLLHDRTQEQIEAEVPGVTQKNVSLWRRGKTRGLYSAKRQALLAYLAERRISEERARELAAEHGHRGEERCAAAHALINALTHRLLRPKLGTNAEVRALARELGAGLDAPNREYLERWIVEHLPDEEGT